MAEAQRIQQAEASGKQFEFGIREGRQVAQLDRVSAQISGAEARQAQAGADKMGALTGMIGGLASTAGSYMSAAATANRLDKSGYNVFNPSPLDYTTSSNLNEATTGEEMRSSMGVNGRY